MADFKPGDRVRILIDPVGDGRRLGSWFLNETGVIIENEPGTTEWDVLVKLPGTDMLPSWAGGGTARREFYFNAAELEKIDLAVEI